MTAVLDRNLVVGTVLALALAALLAWGVRAVPIRLFHAPPVAPEPRASSAWAEPREVDWRPRAAAKAAAPAEPAPSAAAAPAASAARPRAHAPGAPAAAGVPAPAGAPAGAVAVAVGVPLGGADGAHFGAGADAPGTSAAAASAGPGDAVLGPGDVDVPPQPVSTPQPPFPAAAEKLGLSADVLVVLVVEADGSVSHVDTRCASCDASFLRATRDAARRWRFLPARLRGQPVRVRVEQRIRFDLDE